MLLPRHLQNILHDFTDLRLFQEAINAELGHFRIAGVGVGGVADTMVDRQINLLHVAAPQPIIVC